MAGTINPQDSAEAVITALTAGMATQLDAIDTEYGDGITLPDVDKYWRGPQVRYPGHLNVVVVPAASEPDNSPDQVQAHEILVQVVLSEGASSTSYTTTELLTIKLWRIVRAVQELLNKSRLSDSVDMCYMQSADATEIDPAQGNAFMQSAELSFLIQTSD